MNILLIGSGGREHTLAWKMRASEHCGRLYISPGNAGTAACGENVILDINNISQVLDFIHNKKIQMLVVGPEVPLVDGLKDKLLEEELPKDFLFVGPDSYAAQLEGSKDFAKEFMQRYQIPTAAYASYTAERIEEAKGFLKQIKPPYVLKADGLAAGKGVLILDDITEAEKELEQMLCDKKFGEASAKVLIEEFLDGIELSVFVVTDGKDYVLLPEAKDYKRIGEGDTGLNTGGMGSVSPVPFADKAFMQKVEERIIKPTVNGIAKEKMDYKGFVFFGLMKVGDDPYVIEYNVRMGDPETESVIPRIASDIVELLIATAKGELSHAKIDIDKDCAFSVMLVSGGYPEAYEKGIAIQLPKEMDKDVQLFHAGTKMKDEVLCTNGGRVIAVTARAALMEKAREKAYAVAKQIEFDKKNYRKDLGHDLLAYIDV